MSKLLKYMKDYWPSVMLVFVLLIVQAYCDLSLPNYTADILDVGIMQGGIERVCPQVVSEATMENIMLFMDDSQRQRVMDNYVLKSDISKCDISLEENTPLGNVYELNQDDGEVLEQLEDDFGMAAVAYNAVISSSQNSQGEMTQEQQEQAEEFSKIIEENIQKNMASGKVSQEDAANMQNMDMMQLIKAGILDGTIVKDYFGEMYKDMSDLAVPQTAKAMWLSEYEALGVDKKAYQNSYLFSCGGKMLAMAALMMACTIAISYLAARIGSGVGRDLRSKVFKKVVSFSGEEMDRFSTSSLITRSTNDIQQIQMVLTMMLRMCLYAPILGVGGIIKVLNTDTSMAWTIAIAVAAVMLVVIVLVSIAMPKFKIMQKKVDKLNLVTREILTGLPVIRAFSREKHEEQRFDESNKDLTKTMLFTNRVMNFMMPLMMFIMNGVTVLIVWVASKQIDLGKLQVGSMTAFITYAMMIIMSFLMLSMISVMLPRAAVAAQRVDEILQTQPVIYDRDMEGEQSKREIQKGEVRFENVCFHYANADKDVLSNISFTARPGETTAIIGSTGSGKSTIVNLIPRFYDVTQGKITIDGVDIRDYTQHNLREEIGFVPQKGVLFSGDIKSNLSFGCQNASMEVLENAVQIAQAAEIISSKPDGYASLIAQGGNNVSGGQKQRLSIARAVAKDPKIYIFDDSFSALDFKTDAALRKALNKNCGGSTVIIVAQRIVTIQNADNIIVLDEGKIAGQGSHLSLLKNCEVYNQIVKSQLSEKEYTEQMAAAQSFGAKGEV